MKMNSELNGQPLCPLIDFDIIVNQDMGLIKFIQENYQDPNAFVIETLNKSDREILSLLYSRDNFNPLSIISTEENMENIDSLYQSFIDNYRKNIIDMSVSDTSVFKFVELMFTLGLNFGISPVVSVRDEFEEDQIRSHFSNIRIIYRSDIKNIILKDAFYVKEFKFFDDLKIKDKIFYKYVYASPYQYNRTYLKNDVTDFSILNQFIYFGTDYAEQYKKQEENSNEQRENEQPDA